jgi:restriction system protein
MELLGLLLIVAIVIFIAARRREAARRLKQHKELEVLTSTRAIVESHAATLYRKRLQKIKHDDYGNMFDADWQKEKVYFHKVVVKPQILAKYNYEALPALSVKQTDDFIEKAIKEYAEGVAVEAVNIDRLSPRDFEVHCASLLQKGGWNTRTTKASGDQGIDIVGEKNGITAVFQVKKSSTPVGNKAVQEIIAGKAFMNAEFACVVTNARFTPSAKELANISGVRLLHYSELTNLQF